MEAAKTRTVFTRGEVFLISQAGEDTRLPNGVIRTDWVSQWGEETAAGRDEHVAGDWTDEADIEPLSFDVQEIWTSGPGKPSSVTIRNHGPSRHVAVTVYLYTADGIKTVQETIGSGKSAQIKGRFAKTLSKLGIVLSNLDTERKAEYHIEVH